MICTSAPVILRPSQFFLHQSTSILTSHLSVWEPYICVLGFADIGLLQETVFQFCPGIDIIFLPQALTLNQSLPLASSPTNIKLRIQNQQVFNKNRIMFITIWSILAALLHLHASLTQASPLEIRAPATIYSYMKAVAATSSTATHATSCPTSIVADPDDCPEGCAAAPVAGMLGVATSRFSCAVPGPVTSYTSHMATSTCEAGSAVTTFSLWDGDRPLGCHATR